MRKPNVIAIACADLHLQHNPPSCRSNEPDWYKTMNRVIKEIDSLRIKYDATVLCAGDLFNRWNPPLQLVNWAIDKILFDIVAVPGQHDLPQHNYDSLDRCAYYTLMVAGKIINIGMSQYETDDMVVYGCPWGFDPKKIKVEKTSRLKILLIHEYNWTNGCSYPGAPKSDKITAAKYHGSKKWMSKFDVIIFGDNHQGFSRQIDHTTIFNCGTVMRRKTDEKKYKPQVGLVCDDGSVKLYFLDQTNDAFIDKKKERDNDDSGLMEVDEFLGELDDLQQNPLDYRNIAVRYLKKNKVRKNVKEELLTAMGD